MGALSSSKRNKARLNGIYWWPVLSRVVMFLGGLRRDGTVVVYRCGCLGQGAGNSVRGVKQRPVMMAGGVDWLRSEALHEEATRKG